MWWVYGSGDPHRGLPRQVRALRLSSRIDDKAQSKGGDSRFDVLHPRGVAEFDRATDLREVPV
jgi:hypothetical protein